MENQVFDTKSQVFGIESQVFDTTIEAKASGQCRRPRALTPDPDPDPNPRQVSTPRHNPHLIRSIVCSFVLHVRVQGVCVCCLSCTRACMHVCSCCVCVCFVCLCGSIGRWCGSTGHRAAPSRSGVAPSGGCVAPSGHRHVMSCPARHDMT